MRRRRPQPDRVRHTLRNMPESVLANEYGEKIVALRAEMQRAVDALDANDPLTARRCLRRALDEKWWR